MNIIHTFADHIIWYIFISMSHVLILSICYDYFSALVQDNMLLNCISMWFILVIWFCYQFWGTHNSSVRISFNMFNPLLVMDWRYNFGRIYVGGPVFLFTIISTYYGKRLRMRNFQLSLFIVLLNLEVQYRFQGTSFGALVFLLRWAFLLGKPRGEMF